MSLSAEEDKLDEMEAETPEHLSELEQGDGQQDAPDQAGGNTSKPSSPHAVTAEVNDQPPTSSEGKVRHRREQRSSSRHSDEKPVGDEAASGVKSCKSWPVKCCAIVVALWLQSLIQALWCSFPVLTVQNIPPIVLQAEA